MKGASGSSAASSTDRDAGLLFRTTRPTVGFDALRGYFSGLIPRSRMVVLGKTDGIRWTEIARAR